MPVVVGVPRHHCFHEEPCTVMKFVYSFVSYKIHSTTSDTTGNIQMLCCPVIIDSCTSELEINAYV